MNNESRAMTAYVDSGVLVKLYVREANSPAAITLVQQQPWVPLTPLHELEIRNTFRALEGRNAITERQRAASERAFHTDIVAGRLRRSAPDWSAVYLRATELSLDHTTATLARALDILHVAIALLQSSELFITADSRQSDVAARAGLNTRSIQ